MSIIIDLFSQLGAVAQVIPAFATNRREKNRAINEAISSMRRALNRTRIFLRNPDFSNEIVLFEISELWNSASEKVGIIDPFLGRMLGDKSRFWSDHELFIRTGRAQDVIELNQIIDEIDILYNKLNN